MLGVAEETLESSKTRQDAFVVVLVEVVGLGGVSWVREAPQHTAYPVLMPEPAPTLHNSHFLGAPGWR